MSALFVGLMGHKAIALSLLARPHRLFSHTSEKGTKPLQRVSCLLVLIKCDTLSFPVVSLKRSGGTRKVGG